MVGAFALLLIAAGAFAFWQFHTFRRQKQKASRAVRRDAHKGYHCVEVLAGVPACEAVQQFGQTRFLSDEAPVLPVSGCTASHCTCSYVHHADRREDDRRNPYGQWANLPPAAAGERRSRRERRQSHDTFRPSIAR